MITSPIRTGGGGGAVAAAPQLFEKDCIYIGPAPQYIINKNLIILFLSPTNLIE